MEFTGHVQGAAARRYAGFAYRVHVLTEVSMRQLDPERLNYADEYPRSVNPPSQPNTQAIELADYVVRFGGMGNDGMSPVQVWMQPNEYTAARKPLLVCEFQVAHALTLRHDYCDEVLRIAFGET
jgi:hypothetical protein